MARKGSGKSEGKPSAPRSSGGDMRAVVVTAEAVHDLERVVGDVWRAAHRLVERRAPAFPRGDKEAIRALATRYKRELRTQGRQAARDVARVGERFQQQIDHVVDPARVVRKEQRRFAKKLNWAEDRIEEATGAGVAAISTARYWALKFADRGPIFPAPPADTEERATVFDSVQRHNFFGVPVDVKKLKCDIVILGLRINFGLLVFPARPDGSQPPPKVFFPAPEVTAGGVRLRALDMAGPKSGNEVLPAAGGQPSVGFFGYGKILFASDIPDGCRIEFEQIADGRRYLLVSGSGTWTDLLGGDSGTPVPDPPGGYPTTDLGDGMTGMADFPNGGFPTGTPICSYRVVDETFRTWVILVCGTDRTRLGYWEWSFRQIMHMGAPGPGTLGGPPKDGTPAPPGGWPNPGSGPTRWVAEDDASQEAKDEHDAHF